MQMRSPQLRITDPLLVSNVELILWNNVNLDSLRELAPEGDSPGRQKGNASYSLSVSGLHANEISTGTMYRGSA